MILGNLKISTVSDGSFRLDGGSMFGIVPKVLWEKKAEPDAKNRIGLGMNCLLIADGTQNILIETGTGSKLGPKESEIYAVERSLHLEKSLGYAGLKPEQINSVFVTHLHFDHVGGATKRDLGGKIVPTFVNAKYYMQRGAWDEAQNPPNFNRRSYMPENYMPLKEHDRIAWLNGSADLAPGVRVEVSGGHTEFHCCVLLAAQGRQAIFFGDLIPTVAHLRGPYITAYDEFPLETLKCKEHWINKAIAEKWVCIFYHDPKIPLAYLDRRKDGEVEVIPIKDS